MSLGSERRRFTGMLAELIIFAEDQGYGVALDYVKRCEHCPVGEPNSVHKSGLGADINLYDADGNYLSSGDEHSPLHDEWDRLGGAARIDDDLNHYSLSWNGMR